MPQEIEFIQLELIQNMARDDVEQYIDPAELAKIKETDKAPTFDVFRIAHVGTSKSYIPGMGTKILKWFDGAVREIHNSLKLGLKAFHRHKEDSLSHAGRDEVGRLVGKFLKEDEAGKANSYGVFYRYPGTPRDFDGISYEGKMLVPSIDVPGWDVAPEHIGEVTGVAMTHTEKERPAFPKAKRMLQFCIQNTIKEIEDAEEKDTKDQKTDDVKQEEKAEIKKEEKIMEITLEDVKKFIKENNLVPSKLFDKKDLEADELVIGIANKKNENTHYAALRKDDKISELNAKVTKLEKELTGKDAEILTAQKDANKIVAEKKITEIFEKRKLSDKSPALEKWAKRKLKSFVPSGGSDKIETEAKEFIDSLINEFNEYEKDGLLIAIKKEEKEPEKEKDPGKKTDKDEKAKPDSDKKDDFPMLDDSDILNPNLAAKIHEREKEWSK